MRQGTHNPYGARSMTLDELIPSWQRSLRARRRSPRTIKSYVTDAERLAAWLRGTGRTTDPARLGRDDIEGFIIAELQRTSPSSAASAYRRLQQLFKWLVEEDEIDVSPMARMSPPSIPESSVPVLTDDQIRLLLQACAGNEFTERRDTAIIRLFTDTGMRLAELAGLDVDHLDWEQEMAWVVGKGERARACPFGAKTGQALDRYLRLRKRHRDANQPFLWLGGKGRLSDSGVAQMLERRSKQAGIGHVHAHQFRHTFAHRWLAEGGQEGDLQQLAGWRSAQMLARYGASAKAERARAAHKRMALGDSI